MEVVLLASTGFEDPLVREAGPGARVVAPGVVASPRGDDFVFARQVLPDAREVAAPSISRLAAGAVDAVLPALDATDSPWVLDSILPDDPREDRPGELARRLDLVSAEFLERVARARRHTARRRTDRPSPLEVPHGTILVQLLLVARETLWASASPIALLARRGPWPVPFPAGRVRIGDDWTAPSSAFRKLREALAWLGEPIRPGQTCVDLGAAPGGWTHVALEAGASVHAVDRGELDPRLAGHPRLVHVRRNDFHWRPPELPVDWLLCDVIARPERNLAVLREWATSGACRRLVFHVKFQGRDDYAAAVEALQTLDEAGFARCRAKHLYHDKNEVTLLGARAEVEESKSRRVEE